MKDDTPDDDAVEMEADHLPGHREEKATAYRKHKPSSENLEVEDNAQSESNSDSSSSDGSEEVPT